MSDYDSVIDTEACGYGFDYMRTKSKTTKFEWAFRISGALVALIILACIIYITNFIHRADNLLNKSEKILNTLDDMLDHTNSSELSSFFHDIKDIVDYICENIVHCQK